MNVVKNLIGMIIVQSETVESEDFMENVIKIRYDKNINHYVDILAKHFIAGNACIEINEMFEEIGETKLGLYMMRKPAEKSK